MHGKIVPRLINCFPVVVLAGCSIASDLPEFSDTYITSECECLLNGNCTILETLDGTSYEMHFSCEWKQKHRNRAICTYDSKFDFDDPNIEDTDWQAVAVNFKYTNKGWCWTSAQS